ncbi:MAG: AMP-binding protein, partial [Candidatus Binatia bacterium]
WGERSALTYEGRHWSFVELRDEVDRAAQGLIAAGIGAGEHVSLWLGNRPEFVFLFFAVAKIGAVLVPINTRFRTRDMGYIVTQSDSTTLIAAARGHGVDYLAMIEELLPGLRTQPAGGLAFDALPALRRVILLDETAVPGTQEWAALLAAGAAVSPAALRARSAAVDPDATVYIMYTSGTTGFPKGVMQSHNVVRNILDNASRLGITPNDVILDYLPLFHAFAVYKALLMSPATGARHVLVPAFEAGEVLRLIEAERATMINGFDTHYKDLLEHPSRPTRDLSSLRTGVCASGMRSSEPIARRAQALMRTMTGYGMTEIGVGVTGSFLDTDEETRVTMSGWPLPGYEIKIVDPTSGAELPAGQVGEICVRGYQVMQGYYKKPRETAETVDPDGWLHTGDSGLLRADGCMRFLGRYKDLLKVGGENVDPTEVEGLLLDHPGINHVAVVGIPDPRLAEIPVAFVIPEPGAALTADDVLAACRGRIASFKIPRHVFLVASFPMTGSGKIQKYLLREDAVKRLRSA